MTFQVSLIPTVRGAYTGPRDDGFGHVTNSRQVRQVRSAPVGLNHYRRLFPSLIECGDLEEGSDNV